MSNLRRRHYSFKKKRMNDFIFTIDVLRHQLPLIRFFSLLVVKKENLIQRKKNYKTRVFFFFFAKTVIQQTDRRSYKKKAKKAIKNFHFLNVYYNCNYHRNYFSILSRLYNKRPSGKVPKCK